MAEQRAAERRLCALRPCGQRRRDVPAATSAAAPRAAGSHLPGRPPLAAGGVASSRREGAGPRRGRSSNTNSALLPGSRRPAPPPHTRQPMAQRDRIYANLQRPRHSLRKARGPPRPPSIPLPSLLPFLQIPCPISLLCEQERVLDKCEDWKRPLQSSTLRNYAFKRLNGDFRKSGSGIKVEARGREEWEERQHDIAKSENS